MKAALIQLNAQTNKAKNVKKALTFVERAIKNKAEFVLLPEVFVFRGLPEDGQELQAVAEYIPGDSTRLLQNLARKHKIFILAGSLYEKVKNSSKVYNTSVFIGDKGEVKAKYRKIHLFDAVIGKKKIKESDTFFAGKKPVLTKAKNFRIGLSVCYDLRFPDLYQTYSQKGAHMICVPSAFTRKTGQAHWETLVRARAIENLCYVLAPNQTGKDPRGIFSYGHSMIVDPWGKILARASSHKEEIIYAQIDRKSLDQARAILPSLKT